MSDYYVQATDTEHKRNPTPALKKPASWSGTNRNKYKSTGRSVIDARTDIHGVTCVHRGRRKNLAHGWG